MIAEIEIDLFTIPTTKSGLCLLSLHVFDKNVYVKGDIVFGLLKQECN